MFTMLTDTRIILFVVCILLYLVVFFYRDELSQWKERQKLHLKNYLQKHIFAHDINDNGEFIYDNNSLKSVLWDYLDNFLLAPSEAGVDGYYDYSMVDSDDNAVEPMQSRTVENNEDEEDEEDSDDDDEEEDEDSDDNDDDESDNQD
jgi:nucleosome binding factor SPN SPT16 subunit